MILSKLRLSNFQSFGEEITELTLKEITFLIGPNGSGKTAVLQGLCRLFAFDPTLKRIQRTDFHVPAGESTPPETRELWIEADFTFPELLEDNSEHNTIPPHFSHMRLDEPNGIPRVRYRLDANMGIDGDIEDTLNYVLEINPDGTPATKAGVPRSERNNIQIHYLPARRDPADHITFGANALLGRLLRAVDWSVERESVKDLTDQISENLTSNHSISAFSNTLSKIWKDLHRGKFFADPSITFVSNEIEALLRHLSISFSPSHHSELIDFSRLSDGQKSMLYLSLVLSSQAIGRAAIHGDNSSFDLDRLKPADFTIIAIEEPENSLSPHYLGRIVNLLNELIKNGDAQALVATHAPSMLRRIEPENIRYLRLSEDRKTQISNIVMPEVRTSADYKFVREAVQAFPELYFSRLVILGEGDSEEIILPRLLQARGYPVDAFAIAVTPLGGRHVNHFWRLLYGLKIPFITLLDLDLARHQGGWGRISNVNEKLKEFSPTDILPDNYVIPKWDSNEYKITNHTNYLDALESKGIFFSVPMDIDFSMLWSFPNAYEVDELEQLVPNDSQIKAVLGDSFHGADQYTLDEQKFFITYRKRFKTSSKPAAHISALSELTNEQLKEKMPTSLSRMIDAIITKLESLPE